MPAKQKKQAASKTPRRKTEAPKPTATHTKKVLAETLKTTVQTASASASARGKSKQAANPAASTPRPRSVKQYDHRTKTRLNNPPVGLVTPDTDPDHAPKTYAYDAHLDPQLIWAGKAEHEDLTVDTVSLHVHERIDPFSIVDTIRNEGGRTEQPSLFEAAAENPPLREAIAFYKHQHEWSNRLIAGDSLLVMNSLLEREGMAGQVQMVYIDPPYGIKYRSNFQPFTTKRDVADGDKDEDLTQEPEMIRAFRDTWELGIHSFLTYLRDRMTLAHHLLADTGSIFVQIGDENLHHVKELLDEVFGSKNAFAMVTFTKTRPLGASGMPGIADYILWYAKSRDQVKFRPLFTEKAIGRGTNYTLIEEPDGTRRRMTKAELDKPESIPSSLRVFQCEKLASSGFTPSCFFDISFNGTVFKPKRTSWRTNPAGIEMLKQRKRLHVLGENLYYVSYAADSPLQSVPNVWVDTRGEMEPTYVVQTSRKVVQRCVLLASDPGDLVFDPTCGSGTTAVVAEQWGRRWITCDTSRIAVTLAKQRLLTASYEFYELARPEEGVDAGFMYRESPHVTLGSIANSEPAPKETLFDNPYINREKIRVTGPFTVEAVPAPMVAELSGDKPHSAPDASMARAGATQRQADWRGELFKTGIRGLGGAIVKFSRVEPLSGTKYIHAEGETAEDSPRRVVISFGPEYAPLEQRQVEAAWAEARNLDPKPSIILFVAFQFDPEAAKDIDEMPASVTKETTFLKALMNPDMLTGDLKKKRLANESFWLVGRPDVTLERATTADGKDGYAVSVHGFDYYDVKTGQIESGDSNRIALWMLDPDYDGRSLFPLQLFFPNAGDKAGWNPLAKALRSELNEDLLDAYRGTVSIPFSAGRHKRIAVKIVDNRGIESLRVLDLP